MIHVRNRKAVSNLSGKSLRANRARNRIAVAAIALTTLLFTALFTIAGTIVTAFEEQTFRQVGGDMHGTFKDITWEQVQELSRDPLVKSWGARQMLGMPSEEPFDKAHVEVGYMDSVCAKGYFCTPEHGGLPGEGTDQIACDTRILSLLGVEPEIGAKLTLTYELGVNVSRPVTVTDTFTLSGWWEYDPAATASMAIVPRSYAEQKLAGYAPEGPSDPTGKWALNVNLAGSAHIRQDLEAILENHGYQGSDAQAANYIDIGVNWAYVGAQMSNNVDLQTAAAIAALLVLIVLTGYLIIYNIFQISVSNDIRFYGLLKTIGTTGRQIRRIVRRQALLLSAQGIPIGLALGYATGGLLAPAVLRNLSVTKASGSAPPLVFAGAALFSLITVLISCAKPGRAASRVSPVEAVRYTEGTGGKSRAVKRGTGGARLHRMALANLGRNRKKTMLVVLSLALAVVLLEITCTFTNGFDMNQYLRDKVVSDFLLGGAGYFQTGAGFSSEQAVSSDAISAVNAQGGVTQSGRIYGLTSGAEEFVSEQRYRGRHGKWSDRESIDAGLKTAERDAQGNVADGVQLYGMEDFPLDQLDVVDGDLSALYDPARNAIAAVYRTDDYGVPERDSNWAEVGDRVTVRYVDEWAYLDAQTGEPIDDPAEGDRAYLTRAVKYHDVTYQVAAVVTMRHSMSYRYYGSDQFVLNSQVFQRDTGTSDVMTYLFNTNEESSDAMESFLKDYTTQVSSGLDYESRRSYAAEFRGFRSMFLLMGGALSLIVGLVGILNFLNAVMTSILARRREFAVLQSIGMTGRQLNTMLICEGVLYAAFAGLLSLAVSLAAGPLLNRAMSGMFWFFRYRFTILPVVVVVPVFLLLGVVLPPILYRIFSKQTVVERLSQAE